MYLHTRLLVGIGTVTLIALAVSVLVPVASVRSDISRETDASMQLAQLLLDVHSAVASAPTSTQARLDAVNEIRRASNLRHVRISLVDGRGTVLATSPAETTPPSALTRLLLSASVPSTLRYPLFYHFFPLGELRVASNPLSELDEIEQRVGGDLAQLTLAILAMGGAIYFMVRKGLRPVAQVQSALTSLQAGNLETRLPRFPLRDLDDISARFNQCAAAMQEADRQRRDLNRRIIQAEEEERRRLARELHDELGQSLTAIKVDAAYIAREAVGLSTKIAGSAHGIERLTADIMELIRSMLARLRPHGLETVGLHETLQDLVNAWQVRVAERFHCTLTIDGDVDSLAADLNITIYRLIQECLTNAVRHSRAKRIAIRLRVQASRRNDVTATAPAVFIDVQESEVLAGSESIGPQGAGLLGMRERVEAQGGELQVSIDSAGGLSLHAWMPSVAEAELANA